MRRRLLVMLLLTALLGASLPVNSSASPSLCTKREARTLVANFADAYNAGHIRRLDTLFSKRDFRSYRVGLERDDPEAQDRSTLRAYFRERHALHDRIRVSELEIGKDVSGEGWGIAFSLQRTTDDPLLVRQGRYTGKGNIYQCKLRVWNMSRGLP